MATSAGSKFSIFIFSTEYNVCHTIYTTAFKWPPCYDCYSWSPTPLKNMIVPDLSSRGAQCPERLEKSVLFCPLAYAICGSPAYSGTGSKYKCPWGKAKFMLQINCPYPRHPKKHRSSLETSLLPCEITDAVLPLQ